MFQFLVYLLVDILAKFNKLNKLFEVDYVDVTQIGANLNIHITMLCQRFTTIGAPTFGRGSKFLWPFLKAFGVSWKMVFPLLHGTQMTHILHEGVIYGYPSTIEKYMIISVECMLKVVDV